ncbi:MAG: hypothetical protein KJ062_04460 [Thermoanaerobaculia bacterium]|nr:hypothetical protein [Thermoanaerobaculia bacterium]
MLTPKAGLLSDVLEEHLEELAFLWELRREGLLSPERTRGDLARLEARIEAHVDGLLLARGDLLELAEPGLASDDPPVAFASAFALLRSGREGAVAVMESFRVSSGGCREGLGEALAHGDVRDVKDELVSCLASPDPALAVAAATALALQRAPGLPDRADERFLADADPALRSAGWRLATFLREAPRAEAVRKGLEDADPGVARAAAAAAAWFSMPAALEECRSRAKSNAGDAAEWLRLLAVLGDASDLSLVLSAAADRANAGRGESGPRALGALGHPRGVDALLGMMGDEPARAAAAGAAFLKITGHYAEGDARAAVREPGATDDEADVELLDEVTLPDAGAARAFWSGARGAFAGGTRWCHGRDVSDGCPGELPETLDMESRHELRLRGRFTGVWKGDAAGLWKMAPSRD